MSLAALRYSWLTYRKHQLWFPLAFLVFFALAVPAFGRPAVRFAMARAYLGFLGPLVAGMLAAHAVLGDPALELRFATPASPARTLAERLGLVLAVQAFAACVFQVLLGALAVDLAPLGSPLDVQLAWILPTLVLAALGLAVSLAAASSEVGAFLVAAVWLIELLMRSWMETNAKPLFLFLALLEPGDPGLATNRATLALVAALLLLGAWRLLGHEERYV